ncbi:hypothetical protein FMJ01_RS13160, partial [Enterococcus hirae]
ETLNDNYTQILIELKTIKSKMNNDNIPLWELKDKNEYFYEFNFLRETLNKEAEIFEVLKQEGIFESEEIKQIYKYFNELLKEFKDVLD